MLVEPLFRERDELDVAFVRLGGGVPEREEPMLE
jgi:hypothetical protein